MGHGCSQKQTCCSRDSTLRNELSVEYDNRDEKEKEAEELVMKPCAPKSPRAFSTEGNLTHQTLNGYTGEHDSEETRLPVEARMEKRDSERSRASQLVSNVEEEGFEYNFRGFKWYFEKELPELEQHPSSSSSSSHRSSITDTPNESAELRPLHTFSTLATYHGWWRGHARHGEGVQVWPDGARYEGQWVKNCADGQGRFTQANGDIYIGQWRTNKAHGLGIYYHNSPTDSGAKDASKYHSQDSNKKGANGVWNAAYSISYTGQWSEDLQHGVGVERWKEGLVYEGNFNWGEKSGFGTYRWTDGSMYRGEFVADAVCGYGMYVDRSGQEYKGMWYNGSVHGTGKYSWPNGEMYAGQWVEDQRQGFGIFRFADGRRFDGYWHQGKQHGEAIIEAIPQKNERKRGEQLKTLVVWRHGKRVCAGSANA